MYSNNDLDITYANENILLNFNKKSKSKFNMNIIKNLNFGNVYNNLILLLKKNNTINLIKNYRYYDELFIYFNCYYVFYYYIVKKLIIIVKNGFYFNYKFEGIQLTDFLNINNSSFIKIIKLLIKYRFKKKIEYHFRYVNLNYIGNKVVDLHNYKIFKYLLKNKLIIIKKKDMKEFDYHYNNTYYFKKILKYLKINIKKNNKIQKKHFNLLLTQKSLKIKKSFDKKPNFTLTPIIFSFYKKNIYYKNIKFII